MKEQPKDNICYIYTNILSAENKQHFFICSKCTLTVFIQWNVRKYCMFSFPKLSGRVTDTFRSFRKLKEINAH